jgi:hypothetical protein
MLLGITLFPSRSSCRSRAGYLAQTTTKRKADSTGSGRAGAPGTRAGRVRASGGSRLGMGGGSSPAGPVSAASRGLAWAGLGVGGGGRSSGPSSAAWAGLGIAGGGAFVETWPVCRGAKCDCSSTAGSAGAQCAESGACGTSRVGMGGRFPPLSAWADTAVNSASGLKLCPGGGGFTDIRPACTRCATYGGGCLIEGGGCDDEAMVRSGRRLAVRASATGALRRSRQKLMQGPSKSIKARPTDRHRNGNSR